MSILDRIRDGFKYLDKNGLKHLIEKIKAHDVHWTGTHAEYEAVKDTIPAYAILHFTDDYDDSIGLPALDWDNAVELSAYTSSSNVYTTPKSGILKVCCGQRAANVLMRVHDKTLINKFGIIGNDKDGCIFYGQAVSGETKVVDLLVNKDAEIYITGYSCGYVYFVPYLSRA